MALTSPPTAGPATSPPPTAEPPSDRRGRRTTLRTASRRRAGTGSPPGPSHPRGGGRRPAPAGASRPPARPAIAATERATAILAAGTFASRLTGFLRVLAIGYVLGVSSLSDAYNYANGIPNIIYDLLLGGILSATLIPVFVEQLRSEDRAGNMRAISAVTTAIAGRPGRHHRRAVVARARGSSTSTCCSTRPRPGGPSGPSPPGCCTTSPPRCSSSAPSWCRTALLNARRNFTAAAFSPSSTT